jgi:lipoyl-dependent peroxiredoxin
MSPIVKVLHTGRTTTTGGREQGAARSSDGLLDIRLSIPGSARIGANPEQLLAAAWSASFESALSAAALGQAVVLPVDVSIEAEVDLCVADDACFLKARLNVSLPGVERQVARTLLDEAHRTCAYCKATRDNIDVVINLI